MADVLKEGMATLVATMKAMASETITYARGYDSVQVQSIFGKKLLRLPDAVTGTLRVEWTDMDFMIPADGDFHFGDGVLIVPQRGDVVWVENLVGQFEAYEVLPFSEREPAWRWNDTFHMLYRIHTKQVSADDEVPYSP